MTEALAFAKSILAVAGKMPAAAGKKKEGWTARTEASRVFARNEIEGIEMEQVFTIREGAAWALGIAVLVAALFIIWGAFKYMTSMDDPKAGAGARTTLKNALIGLALAAAALAILLVLGEVPVDPDTLPPIIVEGVYFGKKGEQSDGPPDTRTIQIKFSNRVCVQGLQVPSRNLVLRTNRGDMPLLTEDDGAVKGIASLSASEDCGETSGKQTDALNFQVSGTGIGTEVPEIGVLGLGGGVDIVSPKGGPVNDDVPEYTCTWQDNPPIAKGGATRCS